MSSVTKITEELNQLINEVSDELANKVHDKRVNNFVKAKLKGKGDEEAKKLYKNAKLMKNRQDEEFTDEMSMLTDINDLDFPDALADTVSTTPEGEVLTLEHVFDQVTAIKDELLTQIQDLKTELQDVKTTIKDEVANVSNTVEDTIEDEIEDELDDIEFEDDFEEPAEESTEETEELEVEENEEPDTSEEEVVEEDEVEMEESLKNEDLQKTKQEVDKMSREGKSAKQIKDTITMMSDDDKEQEQASDYALDKLKESLTSTSRTSKLKDLIKE